MNFDSMGAVFVSPFKMVEMFTFFNRRSSHHDEAVLKSSTQQEILHCERIGILF